MRTLCMLFLSGLVIASCAPMAQGAPPAAAGTNNSSAGNRDIMSVATEGPLTETVPAGEATSLAGPLIMTVNPTPLHLVTIQGNTQVPPATLPPLSVQGWKTFTSSSFGVAFDFPADWSVAEKTDGATFTSPQGSTIFLKIIPALSGNEVNNLNQRCISRTNSYNLTADVCSAGGSNFSFSALFKLKKADGSMEWLALTTTARESASIFDAMLNTVRTTP